MKKKSLDAATEKLLNSIDPALGGLMKEAATDADRSLTQTLEAAVRVFVEEVSEEFVADPANRRFREDTQEEERAMYSNSSRIMRGELPLPYPTRLSLVQTTQR